METHAMLKKVDEIMAKYNYASEAVIPALQEIQDEVNYLPKEALQKVSDGLKVPISQVYHIATFYRAFSLKPRGKYICTVCLGTACHVRGAANLLKTLERDLEIKTGETTKDLLFTLEAVNCVGCCALAPVIICENEYHGNMTHAKAQRLIRRVRAKDKKKIGQQQDSLENPQDNSVEE